MSSVWFEYIKQHIDKPWNFNILSSNPNITWETVIDNPDYVIVPTNRNIRNQNKRLNYIGLSENPNVTWDIIIANQNKPWNYTNLSRNPNVLPKIL